MAVGFALLTQDGMKNVLDIGSLRFFGSYAQTTQSGSLSPSGMPTVKAAWGVPHDGKMCPTITVSGGTISWALAGAGGYFTANTSTNWTLYIGV